MTFPIAPIVLLSIFLYFLTYLLDCKLHGGKCHVCSSLVSTCSVIRVWHIILNKWLFYCSTWLTNWLHENRKRRRECWFWSKCGMFVCLYVWFWICWVQDDKAIVQKRNAMCIWNYGTRTLIHRLLFVQLYTYSRKKHMLISHL